MNLITAGRILCCSGAFALALLWPGGVLADGMLDRPSLVADRLAHAFGCKWATTLAPYSECPASDYRAVTSLRAYPARNGSVETVEFYLLVDTGPDRSNGLRPRDEARARGYAAAVVATLLPQWRDGPRWVRRALRSLTIRDRRRAIRVDGAAVLVQYVNPPSPGMSHDPSVARQDAAAYVTITRSNDLERYNYNSQLGPWSAVLSR